jgi:lipoate-protein ligase A
MYDSDIEVLGNALQVSPEKIVSKGVKSVKSRVTNIRPYMKDDRIPIAEFKKLLAENMFAQNDLQEYQLTKEDLEKVRELADKRYAAWEWNYGKSPMYDTYKKKRFEGCGQLEAGMNIDHGFITEFDLYGDFFCYRDKEELCGLIKGSGLDEQELRERLSSVDISEYIHNLTENDLIHLILD